MQYLIFSGIFFVTILVLFFVVIYKMKNVSNKNLSNLQTKLDESILQNSALKEEIAVKCENIKQFQKDLGKSQIELEQKENKIESQTFEIISLKEEVAKYQAINSQTQKQLKLENDILEVVKKEFSTIALNSIKKEQDDLLKNNQSALSVSLEPLNKQLETFKQEISTYKDTHIKNTSALNEKLSELSKNSVQLNETAINLSNALTQNKNVKGWYGEDLAKTILEKSGFVEGLHFKAQNREETLIDNSDKKVAIPDYEVFLPDNRNLVIDAKAILSSIVNVQEENDEEKMQKEVFEAVKARIDELSSKKYQNIIGLRQPEFVIMYIPIEPVVNLLYTTSKGIELINYSRKNNIVITGSVSLVTIINLINWIWKENDRIANLDKIIEQGTKIYEAICVHAEELTKIQKSLNDAKSLTDETIKRFGDSRSKYNIFKSAQKLKEFGISSNKQIPINFVKE